MGSPGGHCTHRENTERQARLSVDKNMGDRDTCVTWAAIHTSHVKEEFHFRHLVCVKRRICGKGWPDAVLCSLGSLHNLIILQGLTTRRLL